MDSESRVGLFEDEKRAKLTVSWLRRSGVSARIDRVGSSFEVLVRSGADEQAAHRVLQALEDTHRSGRPAELTGWESVRSRLFNLESVGTVFALLGIALVLLIFGIGLWAYAGMIGWTALIVVIVAGLAYFHFSGLPHSAVKAPRPFSHKHDITMEDEQQVQYRMAWARDQWQRSRRRSRRGKKPKN